MEDQVNMESISMDREPNILEALVVNRDFYLQDTMTCLQQCLGKIIVTEVDGELTAARIVEAEAYIGGIDKASHSYLRKKTKRTAIQFSLGGYAYIFSVHTHNQFCFVTGAENVSDVILVRGVEPLVGKQVMERRRQKPEGSIELGNGPGKLCVSLGIHKELYGKDHTISREIWIADDNTSFSSPEIVQTKRIGINYAEEFRDVPWRYYVKQSPFVSKK